MFYYLKIALWYLLDIILGINKKMNTCFFPPPNVTGSFFCYPGVNDMAQRGVLTDLT